MMKYLMIISMVAFPTVTNAQMVMTTDNHSLTRATTNAPQTSPTYSWQPNTYAGATQGWQSTVPTGGARPIAPELEELE
jgi:hypothetical protein